MLEMEPLVSVIILEYNNYEDTVECIESVLHSNYSNYKIIVVDNYSDVNVFKKLKKTYSNSDLVHVIRSKRNGGYGYGNNVGMIYSEKMKPEYFFILSNDTVIEKNTIRKLVEHLNKKSNLGISFPLTLLHYNKNERLINSAGGIFCKYGFANDKFFRRKYQEVANKIDNNFFYAPGMGFMVRSSIAKEIDYFDQNIFLYWDDVDFSWRVRLLGYDIEINPDAINYHKQYISSGKQKNPFKIYHREFSWLYVLFKNLKFSSFLKYFVFYINIIIIKTLYSLKNRHFVLAALKAYYKFLREIKTNISFHKKIQSTRKVKEKEILKYHTIQPLRQALLFRDTG